MKICQVAILPLSLILFTSSMAATIGTITEQVQTPPSIQRQKQTLMGSKGTGLEMSDTVRTQQGKVGLTFADNTRVQVTENSKLVIDDFVYDPNSNKGGKLAVNIALGTVRYASGQIAKNNPQSVAVNTPSATIGVRGTDFTAAVDELGRSTIILLPSCPVGWKDVKTDCKTGEISVTSDEGVVIMNQPFQATVVTTRETRPMRPVILKLDEDQMNNLLIMTPVKPENTNESRGDTKKSFLDVDYLKFEGLDNVLKAQDPFKYSKLDVNFLERDFLVNILDLINAMLKAQMDYLENANARLLPDYVSLTGVVAVIQDPIVQLCREDSSSNIACAQVLQTKDVTITFIQERMEFRNRVNAGGTSTITIEQR
jgi:hypothetical protein